LIQRRKFSAPSTFRKCHGSLYGVWKTSLHKTWAALSLLWVLLWFWDTWYATSMFENLQSQSTQQRLTTICVTLLLFFLSSIHYPQWWTQWPRSLIIHFHMKNCVWCNWNNEFDTFMLEKYLKLQMSSGRQKNWITKQVAKPLIVS
jgi:hypothetical protein